MSSARTRYLIPVLIWALFCAQVMAPAALVDDRGFQQKPAVQLDEDAAKEIARIIEQKHKELLESITKMVNERTAALEKGLAERDKRIASLEKEVNRLKKELAAAPKPKPKPKPKAKAKSAEDRSRIDFTELRAKARNTLMYVLELLCSKSLYFMIAMLVEITSPLVGSIIDNWSTSSPHNSMRNPNCSYDGLTSTQSPRTRNLPRSKLTSFRSY